MRGSKHYFYNIIKGFYTHMVQRVLYFFVEMLPQRAMGEAVVTVLGGALIFH